MSVRVRFVAVLLGVLGCLVAGSGQSFAAPALPADAAPAASPTSEEACGALKADIFYSKVRDEAWAWGSVTNSCPGWDALCSTLYYPSGQVAARWCQPLFSGYSIELLSGRATCVTGWYYGRTTAEDGSTVVKQLTSKRKLFTC